MKIFYRCALRSAFALLLISFSTNLVGQVTWTNPNSGDWNVPSNWSTNAVPGLSDDVVIDQRGNLIINVPSDASHRVNSISIAESLVLADATAFRPFDMTEGGFIEGDFEIGDSANSALFDGALRIDGQLAIKSNARFRILGGSTLLLQEMPVFIQSAAMSGGVLDLREGSLLEFPPTTTSLVMGSESSGMILARTGSVLDFSGITSIDTNTSAIRLEPSSATSFVDLSSLTELLGAGNVAFRALDGAQIDVSDLSTIGADTITTFLAEGQGGMIDVSSQSEFRNSSLIAREGSQILLNSTGFSLVDSAIEGDNAFIDVSSLTAMSGGRISATETVLTFPNIDAASLDIAARTDGIVDGSAITEIVQRPGDILCDLFVAQNGIIDLSGLTELVAVDSSPDAEIEFFSGSDGLIDLSGVQRIYGVLGPIFIRGQSVFDLSSITEMTNTNPVFALFAQFRMDETSQVILNPDSRATLTNIHLHMMNSSTVSGHEIELVTDLSLGPNEATLRGSGSVNADVLVTSGVLALNNNGFEAMLEINGNLRITRKGLVDIVQSPAVIKVAGNLELQNSQTDITDYNLPLTRLAFDVVGDSTGEFANLPQGSIIQSENGFDLKIDYFGGDGNDIYLTTDPIAEVVSPFGVKLLDGVSVKGDTADLESSDNQVVCIEPSATRNPNKQIVDMILLAESTVASPETFRFVFESRMIGGPVGDVQLEVELWNETDEIWESIHTGPANDVDMPVNVLATGDLTRFVHPLTNEVMARATFNSQEFAGDPFSWQVAVDRVSWLVK